MNTTNCRACKIETHTACAWCAKCQEARLEACRTSGPSAADVAERNAQQAERVRLRRSTVAWCR